MNPKLVHIDGKPVRYREAGAGVPLVILSGLGLSSNFYQENLHGLAQHGIRAIAPDLPGFGGSRGRFTGMSIADATAWTAAFCTELQITKVFFLGHSIGCQIALRLGAEHSHRTLGLILSGPTGARRHRLLHQSGALARIALREGTHVLRKVAYDYLRTTPSQYAGWWIRAARDSPLDIAAAIKAPVLILIGSDDPVPTPDFIAELMQRLPYAELSQMPGGLHALPIEQPESFNRQVAAFVRRFESRALPDKAGPLP